MNETRDMLLAKIESGKAHVAVIGLGYVGLPIAIRLAQKFERVIGIDLDDDKWSALKRGSSYIETVDNSMLKEAQDLGRLYVANDYSRVSEVDVIIICVPTPLDKYGSPDLTAVKDAFSRIGGYGVDNQLIILESTSYPGTTRDMMPYFEDDFTGNIVGEDYFVAFSPERINPGQPLINLHTIAKVVGGMTESCTAVAVAFYSRIFHVVVPVSSPEVAEMSKLLENTFRLVNISLVNEFWMMCGRLGINVREVVDAASTKPYGFMRFDPGPGAGGHCIPVDPKYLIWKMEALGLKPSLTATALSINAAMPYRVCWLVTMLLNHHRLPIRDSHILVLGLTYKSKVADVRESPSLKVIELLEESGAIISVHDPLVDYVQVNGHDYAAVPDLEMAIETAQCIVLLTDHDEYGSCFYEVLQANKKKLIDTRGVIR